MLLQFASHGQNYREQKGYFIHTLTPTQKLFAVVICL